MKKYNYNKADEYEDICTLEDIYQKTINQQSNNNAHKEAIVKANIEDSIGLTAEKRAENIQQRYMTKQRHSSYIDLVKRALKARQTPKKKRSDKK